MAYTPIGPTQIVVGTDPTTTTGVGALANIGSTENVSIDLGIKIAYTSNAQRQGAAFSDSIYYMTPEPMASVELKDLEPANIELLLEYNTQSSVTSGTIGFGADFSASSTLPTVGFIPETQKGATGNGIDAANAIWFPRAYFSGVSGIQYGRVSEGEINQPFSIECRSTYVDNVGGAITAGYRMGWMGPPSNAGAGPTSWALGAGVLT